MFLGMFLVVPQSAHERLFSHINAKVTEVWGKEIKVEEYKVAKESITRIL